MGDDHHTQRVLRLKSRLDRIRKCWMPQISYFFVQNRALTSPWSWIIHWDLGSNISDGTSIYPSIHTYIRSDVVYIAHPVTVSGRGPATCYTTPLLEAHIIDNARRAWKRSGKCWVLSVFTRTLAVPSSLMHNLHKLDQLWIIGGNVRPAAQQSQVASHRKDRNDSVSWFMTIRLQKHIEYHCQLDV